MRSTFSTSQWEFLIQLFIIHSFERYQSLKTRSLGIEKTEDRFIHLFTNEFLVGSNCTISYFCKMSSTYSCHLLVKFDSSISLLYIFLELRDSSFCLGISLRQSLILGQDILDLRESNLSACCFSLYKSETALSEELLQELL